MLIIPAIDLKDGKCVRLRQGRADEVTVYGEDPVAMARHWAGQGARFLHVVDLDGAFKGQPVHTALIAKIAAAISIPIEVGGGLRTDEDVRGLLDGGVARGVIGTRALSDPAGLKRLVAEFGARIAVGIDARDGWVQVKGWVETSKVRAGDLAAQAAAAGVRTIIYTDTTTDGMLVGPNVAGVRDICRRVACDVVASGGIVSVAHIKALADLNLPNLAGAIVGKALYEGRTTLTELLAASGSLHST